MNAKEEFLYELKEQNKSIDNILKICIEYKPNYYDIIKIDTLDGLDFDYDDGYGSQELFGFILLDDQDWFERYEYDGAEWWVYKKFPKELLKEGE